MIRRFVKLLAILFMLLLIFILGIVTFFEAQVEKIFIAKVNDYFSTELVVKEDISFSIFQDFPNASLTFHKIELRESLPRSTRNVLEAEKLSFLFGLADAFNDNYTVEKVVVKNGQLTLRSLHNGKVNYDVVASSETTTENINDESFNLSLKEMLIQNVKVLYIDETLGQESNLLVKDATFSGNFGDTKYDMKLQGDMFSEEFYMYDVDYLPKKALTLDLTLGIDFEKDKYTFTKSSLNIEENRFEINGTIQNAKNHTDMDLSLNGVDLKLAEMITLMPSDYAKSIEGLSSKGDFMFQSSIKGRYSETQQPDVKVNFNLENGTLSHANLYHNLKKINIKGYFSNGTQNDLKSSELDIQTFKFSLGDNEITAYCNVKDFNDPLLDLRLNGALDLSTFKYITEDYEMDRLQGDVVFDNFLAEGRLSQFNSTITESYPSFQGKIKLDDINFKYNGKWVEDIQGVLAANGKDFEIETLETSLGKSDLALKGQIARLTPLLFQAATQDSINMIQPTKLTLNLNAKTLDIEDLMKYLPAEEELVDSLKTEEEEAFEWSANPYAVGDIHLDIAKIRRGQLEIDEVAGDIRFNDREFIIQQIVMSLLGGKLDMRGDFTVSKSGNLVIKTFLDCQKINMSNFLADLDNFGQETLTSKNLEGIFSSKAFVEAHLDKQLQLDERSFYMVADLLLEDGRLIDFEPMLALSTFVKLSELRDVRFAKLENQIEIKNRRIRVPAMHINSNVVRVSLSAIHNFNNTILYYVPLNLMDILTGKFKKSNKDVETLANKRGGVNLYVTMSGSADEPKISYMKKRKVKDQFELDMERPKINLDKILEQDFQLDRGKMPALPMPMEMDTLSK